MNQPFPFQKEFLDQISDAVIIVDNDHRITYVNPEAERRYAVTAAEAIGRVLTDIVRYEWLSADAETEAYEALATRGYWRGENIHITRDGRRLQVDSSVTRLLASDGTRTGLMAVIRDVTERKRAEEELRRSHELLRATFDSALGHVQLFEAIRNGDGEIVDFEWLMTNKKWNDEWGEMKGKRLLAENPGVVEAGIFDKFVRATETGESILDEQYYGHEQFDGWYLQSIVKLHDGCLMSSLDITESKLAEQALRESELRYRTLFESIDEGFCVIEVIFDENGRAADYRFLDVNPAFERQTGIPDAVGKRMREIAPQHEQHWFDTYGNVARTGENVRFEHEAAQLDRYYDVFAFRVGEPGENKVGVLFNDVSARRRAEADVRERERLRALVRGQEDERRRIARDLHDDLGQQFTALRMKLDRLARSNGSGDLAVEEIRDLAATIDAAVDRLAWDLRPAALDDLGLTAALERFLHEWSKHTGVPAELLASNMTQTRLPAEIETNLYRIAQEALHNVHKHAAAARVDVMLQRSGGRLRLVVADDGRGFDPEAVDGSGLGLTSMRERASLIGGDLHIESVPNTGTSIHITVPFSPVTKGNENPNGTEASEVTL
jgi:two-component system NarL family sensor kinase